LEVLLRWKGVPVSKMGNVANRRVLYQQFTYRGEEDEDDASIPAPWTDADEAGLVALRNAPIEMADTLYGRFLATQKRDAERAYQHIDAEEREAFLRKLTEIDADDAKDGQSPPSNPTPVLLTCSNRFVLLSLWLIYALVRFIRRRSRPNAVLTNVTISWPPEMSLMLFTEGESAKTAAHTSSR
jgi:hypothetical protein